jgi:hypothetical protein
MERKRESIDIKVLKDNLELEQKKIKKKSCSKYFWKLLFLKIVIENGREKRKL